MEQLSVPDENAFVKSSAPWDVALICVLIGAFLHPLLLNCMCHMGLAKVQAALCVDLVLILRILVARRRGEPGFGCVVYYSALPFALVPLIEAAETVVRRTF